MIKQSWRDRLIDPRSPDRRPRRAAYALPTFFTAGNVFLGFYALMESFQGSMAMISDAASAPHHFQNAALAIGWSVFLDGLDGRIARLTNTVSEFGREMDSLADSISFGLAPAYLLLRLGQIGALFIGLIGHLVHLSLYRIDRLTNVVFRGAPADQ